MKIHHINLCTMCPFGGRFISGGTRSVFGRGDMVIHALLIETKDDGLILVDTGLGLDDIRSPQRRLGAGFVALTLPRLREEDTAARQVERLGFSRNDVRHIVVTHLDVDHAGGLPDFPEATVHIHRAEHVAATSPTTLAERLRYRPVHLAHGPRWKIHDTGGDRWFGFDSIRAIADDVLLIPLPGHTRGHSAVAVRANGQGQWLLHCGDAYFFECEKEDPPSCPPLLAAFQQAIAVDDGARRANAARIRELHREHGGSVRVFSAHCAKEFRAITGART